MIQFSTSGCALVEVVSYQPEGQMMRTVNRFADTRKQEKNVEFILRTGERIIEASDESFYYNGGKARTFTIGEPQWRHLRRLSEHAYITIQQGSWYFSIARFYEGSFEGVGFWYSGDMLKVGWHHGEDPQVIDHNAAMYQKRDFAS